MRRSIFRQIAVLTFLSLATLLLLPHVATAQYFGRNKVQYESFHFKVLNTPHIEIYYYPETKEAAEDMARMAERWYSRYHQIFDFDLEPGQPIILYANPADFQQTNIIQGLISQGTGGVTEGLRNRVVLPLTGSYAENNHVLGHELVHAFQYGILKSRSGGLKAAGRMPLWFIEGMAEYLSLGRDDPLTAMWLRDALLHDKLPTLKKLSTDPNYFPYRWGQAFWGYVTGRWGDDEVNSLFHDMARMGWEKAIDSGLGIPHDSLSAQWKQEITNRFEPLMKGKTSPDSLGEAALTDKTEFNLSPSVSPDGRYVAFIGRNNPFTLDLLLADLTTGKVIHKLVSSNTDAHFDALDFIDAAGAWSPDGGQFAFVVFKDGNNAIAIMDMDKREIKRTIKLDSVDAISQIAWSPDGTTLAVSGSWGGISDLYLYNFKTRKQKRLTDDRYADFQPTWSPDGRTIAWVTDRGVGTSFDSLTFRPLQLGLYDVATGGIRLIALSDSAKHIDPQYSPDGNSLYFVSDPDGFPNVYRYSFESDSFFKVTDVATGVSGLTGQSPALSVAAKTGRMVMTVFTKAEYQLRKLEPSETAGQPFVNNPEAYAGGAEIPAPNESTTVTEYLANATGGLPANAVDSITGYHPSLGLIFAGGGAGVGVSTDRYGSAVGGGASFVFSDLLGNRWLGITAQINGSFKDAGGEVFYQNVSHRFNWSLAGGHIPYLSVYYAAGYDSALVNGTPAQVFKEQLIYERTYFDQVTLGAQYPLSTNRRFEVGLGLAHVYYNIEADQAVWYGNYLLDQSTQSLPTPSGIMLAQTDLAYVGDYSLFGFTSPVKGTRYRLEVQPNIGTIRYMSILADFRHYQFIRPFTLAFRAMHYGRYLKDADNDRLSPLYLGYETLVRGYTAGSLTNAELQVVNGRVPEYDRLLGSRLAVVNAEVRFPLFGTTDYGLVDFAYLPTELVAFFDGGVAWYANDPPKLKWATNSTERIPVFSAGVAVRVNVLGALVGQVYMAFPFQRPQKTTQFGFVIAPGW